MTVNLNRRPLQQALPGLLHCLAVSPPLVQLEMIRQGKVAFYATTTLVPDSISQSITRLADNLAYHLKGWFSGEYQTAPPSNVDRDSIFHGTQPSVGWHKVFARVLYERLLRSYRWRFFTDDWRVAVAKTSISALIDVPSKVSWRSARWAEFNGYVADPFILATKQETWLLVELFDQATGKGVIGGQLLEPTGPLVVAPSVLLELPDHLSYPYLFCFQGANYLMPENADSQALKAYPVEMKDRQLVLGSPVVIDIETPLYDATLFQHGGYYWLLGTVAAKDTHTQLALWFAQTPFGPWTRHRYWPLLVNIQCGRPAGKPFYDDGALVIPLQNSAIRYGEHIELFRVTQLTPTDVRWHHLKSLYASDLNIEDGKSYGLHTLSWSRNAVAVDYLKYRPRGH
ncbi:MAG: hypothetical protein P1U54_10925 [Immundisolibacteraceae bacterium]|nr:hypothetical protein [Immundisolibacteraceae bacterium]